MPKDEVTLAEFGSAVRSAIADRAQLLALLVREMANSHPEVDFDAVVRSVTFQLGVLKGQRSGAQPSADAFLQATRSTAGQLAFEQETVESRPTQAVQLFHRCPLVDAWRELGASDAEVAHLCSLAAPIDDGTISVSPDLTLRFDCTIAQGAKTCTMVIEQR